MLLCVQINLLWSELHSASVQVLEGVPVYLNVDPGEALWYLTFNLHVIRDSTNYRGQIVEV